MSETNPHIERAISVAGSQAKLAEATGISQSSISRMLLGQSKISAEDAVAIERGTACAVMRHQMRPDLWPMPMEARA